MRVAIALFVSAGALSHVNAFTSPQIRLRCATTFKLSQSPSADSHDGPVDISRRNLLHYSVGSSLVTLVPTIAPLPANAGTKFTNAKDGNLPELPPEASKSYLQYRVPLQISADFYMFDLQDKMGDIDEWGDINTLFQINNSRAAASSSRIEREFVNPMRILGTSMPPDEAERMRESQFKFEKAMASISKAVVGVRRDLPVEVDKSLIPKAKAGWEDGRVALNEFFDTLNEVTGLPGEMKTIPPAGPNQLKDYGRSQRRYFELTKKTKLCQNRGGPALSQAWGGLMISGYLQDSCGIPDLDEYFFQ